MTRFLLAGFLAITAAFAQQQQPWSEQLPTPQPPNYGGPNAGPINGPANGPVDDGSAPDRGVARLGYLSGNVAVRRGDSGEAVSAAINAPLVAGDRLVTADNGRAEIQFDAMNLIRIGGSSEVRLSEIAYHRYQIQIATGVTMFRMVRDSDAQIEISTPSVAVRPLRAGVYRISVLPDGTSQITVRLGEAEVFSPRGSEPLQQGKTMMARGSASDPEFQLVDLVGDDEFERWCVFRDRQMQAAQPAGSPSARNMGPDMAGAQDLDANGRWMNDGSYGNVWVPNNTDPGWAPYSCGRWAWVDFYGWTWVGCESWGWAPYHYGRWYQSSFGWAWWPGVVVGRPYYWRPALVGFFGWGGGVGLGFGFGFGNIGWIPLGPGEFFHPWYGRGFYGGFRPGAVVNVNVMSAYRNARFTNAVSSMRAGEFGHGSVNGAGMIRPQAGELARAGAVHGQLPVSPTHESTQFSSRAATTAGMPHTNENAHFASHMQSSQTSHVSFEQQRQSFSQAGAHGGSSFGNNSGGFNGGARAGAGPSTGSTGGGWQHVGSGGSAAGSARGGSPQGNPNPGYRGGQPSTGGTQYGGQARGGQPGGQTSQGRPSYSQQQPVRISPPMVQNHPSGGSSGGSRPSGGGSHPSGGGGKGHR